MPKSKAAPFVKWLGGKRRLIGELDRYIPQQFNTYHEPFVGGGAVYFHLFNRGLLSRSLLSDITSDLIVAYHTIQNNVDGVIKELEQHRNEETHFYMVRSWDPEMLTNAERTARFIYLNKTAFNGLYRVNKNGKFNAPFGRYTNPNICDREGLYLAHKALNGAGFHCGDYRDTIRQVTHKDLVYIDPPYIPIKKDSFTGYSYGGFTEEDHMELRNIFEYYVSKGAYVILSNSAAPQAYELYKDFRIEEVYCSRPVSSRKETRGKVKEVLVLGNIDAQ